MVADVATELQPPALFIITLYIPGINPDKLLPVWKLAPLSKLYVSPAVCTVTVIVPVGTEQEGWVRETVGADGKIFIVTTISALGLSQPIVWLTQYEVFPESAVEGVGAVALPVPPVAVVYHNKPVPVAVSGVAVDPWQYVAGVVTAGARGEAPTITTISALGPSQLLPLV